MTWFDIHGARAYVSQGQSKLASRATIYNMVAAGMKVARSGETGLDSKGRRIATRMLFCEEWIDAFLEQRSKPKMRIKVA